MKKGLASLLAVAAIAGALMGCNYAGVGAAGDKAVVARNDAFLFGILRKVYVCKITDGGLSTCQDSDSP
jgi:hypothetical protein